MSGEALNTDRELWRERQGDYYADSIHITQSGAIGINCGGTVIVMPIRKWHDAAREIGQLYNEVRRLESNRDGLVIEIKRLEARVKEVEASMVSHFQREHLEGDGPEIDRWKARVRELTMLESYHRRILDVLGYENPIVDFTTPTVLEKVQDLQARFAQVEQERDRLRQRLGDLEAGKECVHLDEYQVVKAAKDLVWQRDQLGARVRELEQERDRLREQYNKVLGAIDEGLVEDDATLAAASVTEMHATINRLRDENTDLQHRVTRYDAEMRELVRLRGLIGALPAGTDAEVAGFRRSLTLGGWSNKFAEALAALLREK